VNIEKLSGMKSGSGKVYMAQVMNAIRYDFKSWFQDLNAQIFFITIIRTGLLEDVFLVQTIKG